MYVNTALPMLAFSFLLVMLERGYALFPYTTLFRSSSSARRCASSSCIAGTCTASWPCGASAAWPRSEEHTSELQSRLHLVCRLLLEKKNTTYNARPRLCCAALIIHCCYRSFC